MAAEPTLQASQRDVFYGTQDIVPTIDELKKGWQQIRSGKPDRRPKRGAAAFQVMNDESAGAVEQVQPCSDMAPPVDKKRKRQCASPQLQPTDEMAPSHSAMKTRRTRKRPSSM